MQNEVILNSDQLKSKSRLSILLELSKIRITGFVAFSAIIGYLLTGNSITINLFVSAISVFILAAGSASLNHWQEHHLDSVMERTKLRPIPSGRISPNNALLLSLGSIAFGLIVLYLFVGTIPAVLGLITALFYNLVYTPMKRISAMAVIPGGIIGAVPPIIGWTSAGGNLTDFGVLTFALFLFVWQIPHFWLLLLMFGDDYNSAGFPTLKDKFSDKELSLITFGWIAILVISSILFTLSDFISNPFSASILIIAGIWILKESLIILKSSDKVYYKKSFLNINLYVLFIVLLITIDKLVIKDFLR